MLSTWPRLIHKFKVSSSICLKPSQIWPFIALDLQPNTFALKKKENEQQFSFNRKVAKTSRAALKALESGEIPKAKEEPNIGISLITTRQKIICLLYTSPSPRDQRGSRMPSSA